MPIYLGRLIPICRIQRNRKVRTHLLEQISLRLQNASIGSTTGTRNFSRSAVGNRKTTAWRRFKKSPEKTPAKEKEAAEGIASRAPLPDPSRIRDPRGWIDDLEPFLLPHLRSSFSGDPSTLNAKQNCAAITDILVKARENADIDVLARLGLNHGRWSAVLSIVEALIADAAAHITNGSSVQLPSNLDWPTSTPFDDMTLQSIELGQTPYSDSASFAQWDKHHLGPSYTDQTGTEKYRSIEQIWMSLGSIVLESSDLPSELSNQVLVYAYQIIARLHSSGFVPDHIYSSSLNTNDSAVRRPPILHLLSSRMLTTLSDAAWRAHQDEVIARAACTGATYRELGHDPPGGRFRLKVRDLGPEVWLEFILWCCVDGGFASAGCWIVERMRTRTTESTWFAVQWTGTSGDEISDVAMTSWASVKLRPGGTVGQIEGYSREKPCVEMESRTISVEVVLALIEAFLNGRNPGFEGRGYTQESALTSIVKLLMFLEPHGLRAKYFDYLTVRLLQPLLFDFENDPGQLQSLVDRLGNIRSLETTHKPAEYLPSLEVDFILEQSEVHAGALHQALECLAVHGRIHPTVEMFSRIQDLVDQNKLRSIGAFLHSPRRPDQGFFSPRDFTLSPEYSASHGQLPAQKLAPFLDALTFAGLTELGQWLLYSMDVDGPLIPLSLYSQSSISPSVLRFAAATGDQILMNDVTTAVGQRTAKPQVNFLRSFTDAKLQLKDFENAHRTLVALNNTKGGGNSLRNVATIAAMVFRIESSAKHVGKERRPRLLSPGLSLLDGVLKGDFRGIAGDFRKNHITDYRRGLAGLLRVFEAIPDTVLSDIAQSWIKTLGESNIGGFDARVFDILLSAVVETRGAKAGMMLWDLFCEEPAQVGKETRGWVETAEMKLVSTPNGLEFQPTKSPFPGSRIWSPNSMLPIRIDMSIPNTTCSAEVSLHTGSTSEDALFAEEYDFDAAKESDAGLAMGDGDVDETGSGASETSLSRIARNRSGLEEKHPSLADKLSISEQRNGPPPRNPPSADVSLLPTEFCQMISEESVSAGPTNHDVSPLPSSPSLPNPVIRPTFRTLRIVLRTALQELEIAKKLAYIEDWEADSLNTSHIPAQYNMRNLETAITDFELVEQWARPLFRKFGIRDEEVAAEFGWKLGEMDSKFSTEELQKRYASARTEYELAKMGLLADMPEVDARKRFLGPKIRNTKGDVKNYTARELAFYFGQKKS
jgi:hypothetical protein